MRAQVTALACSLPREKEKTLSRWSLAEIARRLVVLKVVLEISVSTLWRWSAAERIKLLRYHHWQHILDPQGFMERARPVLQVYAQAVELLQQGLWALCLDEKTSIQARQLAQEPVAATAGQPMHVAPRYIRHGVLQLFAALSVADGRKYARLTEANASGIFKLSSRKSSSPKRSAVKCIP